MHFITLKNISLFHYILTHTAASIHNAFYLLSLSTTSAHLLSQDFTLYLFTFQKLRPAHILKHMHETRTYSYMFSKHKCHKCMHFWPALALGSSVQKASWDASCRQVFTWLVCEREAADSQRGCLADLAAHVALFPSPSFLHHSSSSLLSAITAVCPKLPALGYINVSSSLKMTTSQLWCSSYSSSHWRVSCGGPFTAVGQGQQRQANDSNSRGSLWGRTTL